MMWYFLYLYTTVMPSCWPSADAVGVGVASGGGHISRLGYLAFSVIIERGPRMLPELIQREM